MSTNKQSLIDNTSTAWVTYICNSDIWTAESQNNWQIKAVFTWPPTVIKYPVYNSKPTDEYVFKASDRTTLTYWFTS